MSNKTEIRLRSLLQEIQTLFASGDVNAAIAVCEDIIDAYPAETTINTLFIELLLTAGRTREALEKSEELALKFRDDDEILITYASALFENLRFEEALEILLKQDAGKSDSYDTAFFLANTYAHLGAEAEAMKTMKKVVVNSPHPIIIYPPLTMDEITGALNEAVSNLPPEIAQKTHELPIEIALMPKREELAARNPPLSPFTQGLLNDDGICLFKTNLEWTCKNYTQLVNSITLLLTRLLK